MLSECNARPRGESMRRYDWLFAISLAWIGFLAIAFVVIAIPLVFAT
jgi:hypothetical protein